MEKLKPCPQGHNNTLLFQELPSLGGKNDGYYFHECEICGWRGPKKKTPESAISAWNTRVDVVPTIPISRLDEWLQRRSQFVEELYTPIDITMDWEGASVITNEYADGVLGTLQDLIDLLNKEKTQ